jgi:addiction module HigA family antidote
MKPFLVVTHHIRAWREHRKLTMDVLANSAGLTPSMISQLELGRTRYTQQSLEKIAVALGVEPWQLLADNPEKKPSPPRETVPENTVEGEPQTQGNGNGWSPDWAVHPGEHLLEHIEVRGLSRAELARMADLSPKLISAIIAGKEPISPETAAKLERVLGMKSNIWTGLQADWDLHHQPSPPTGEVVDIQITAPPGVVVRVTVDRK